MPWRNHACRLAFSHALTSVMLAIVTVTPAAAQFTEGVIDDRVASAAHEARIVGEEWLGAHPVTPDLHLRRAWWHGPGAMIEEQQAAQQVIRGWWPAEIADPQAAEILDGFASYLQGYAVEQLFDRRYLRLAHRVESLSYLGGHVIWSFPTLRLSRGVVDAQYRYAAVFAALERWIGAPHLQAAMFEVAHLPAAQLTAANVVETISTAAGQDLSWAFDAAAADMNYAVTGLASESASGCGAPCIDTTVTVTREGAGMFTGRSAPRIDRFESGDALLLQVTFADHTTSFVRWDGRDQSRAFQFRGPSGAIAAHLDPDGIVTLDRNRLDNALVRPVPTNVPVHKWAARWMVWLQHTVLTYGLLA